MFEQPPQAPAFAPRKAWYSKWWVWLVAALVFMVGVGAVLVAALVVIVGAGAVTNPSGETGPPGASPPTQSAPVEPTASETPSEPAPLDLEAFLTDSNISFESVRISAQKAYIYVPTETTNEQAQQIANNAMLYICGNAQQAGEAFPAANRVDVSDSVSAFSPGYNAADHPSGFATEEICGG